MSGRWRSRHWRSSAEGVDQGREQQRPREFRDRSGERQQSGSNDEYYSHDRWGHDDKSERDGGGYEYQPWQRSNGRRSSSLNDHSDDRGEWRRGQHLPSSSSDFASRHPSRERTSSVGRGDERRVRHERDASVAGGTGSAIRAKSAGRAKSASRTGSVGRAARPTFPAPPPQAWGNNNKPLGRMKSGAVSPGRAEGANVSMANDTRSGTVNSEESRGWAKPDSDKPPAAADAGGVAKKQIAIAWPKPSDASPKTAGSYSAQTANKVAPAETSNSAKNSASKRIIKREDGDAPQARIILTNSNPWGKPAVPNNAKSSTTTISTTAENPAFPSWNASEGGGNNSRAPTAPKKEAPSISLLPTSSWGKSKPAAQSLTSNNQKTKKTLTAAQSLTSNNQKTKKTKVEDFPSLSMASKMPRAQPPPHSRAQLTTAKVVTPIDENLAKGGRGSKKSAAPSNLASFLSPPAGKGASNSKNKESRPSSAQKIAGAKRGNNAAKPKPHPATSMLGVKRSAPSSKTTLGNHRRATGGDFLAGDTRIGGEFPTGGKGGVAKKGRQRLGPRKKKLTTLKKRVLKERLRVWKERNGIVDDGDVAGDGYVSEGPRQCKKRLKIDGSTNDGGTSAEAMKSTTMLVENFVRPEEDDLADEDEHDEIVSNLISLAGRVGRVLSVFIPRPQQSSRQSTPNDGAAKDGVEQERETSGAASPAGRLEANHVGSAFVRFATTSDVCAAKDILDEMIVGGQKIRTDILMEMAHLNDNCTEVGGLNAAPSEENDRQWRLAVLKVMDDRRTSMDVSSDPQTNSAEPPGSSSSSATTTITFHKILCDDDYEDEEALEESIEDIKGLALQYGPVEGARAATSGDDKGNVYIVYGDQCSAEKAEQQLNGIIVGGSKILVRADRDLPLHDRLDSKAGEVILTNVLNDDDFEDEDCLQESIEDIKNIAFEYGKIGNVNAEVSGDHKGRVTVLYLDGQEVARRAAQELNGMVVGGATILASVASSEAKNSTDDGLTNDETENSRRSSEIPQPPPPPMYSGEKVIPEGYAACKRVPKIPNPGVPRAYATKIPNENALPTLISMLGELMRLQERSKDDKNARARRRLVMGLREVARGIRAHKVKMVVMANNLDDYGAIDSKLEEILELARAEDLPVLFELNKRKLGRALGKSIKVSVVGVQNADGAHEQFKKLKKMMGVA